MAFEALGGAALSPENAARTVGFARVETAGASRLVLVGRSGTRLREIAVFGPFAASEESQPSLVALPSSGPNWRVGVRLEVRDSCGNHEAIVDLRSVDAGHGRATAESSIDPWSAGDVTITANPEAATASRRYVAVGAAIGIAGPSRVGLENLVDADSATVFPLTDGASRFVVRWTLAPLRIRGMSFDAVPGAHGAEVRVRAGDTTATVVSPATGGPVTALFASPVTARCVEIELGTTASSARALRSIALVAEVDEQGAAARLVTELASEGARSDLAIAALVELGSDALAPLEAAFADATTQERRRMLRAAEGLAPREPNALRLFVLALESDDETLRSIALERCLAIGAPGTRALSVALSRGSIAVALPLAERAPDVAFDPLFARLAVTDSDDERRLIHRALVIATRRSPTRGRESLRRFVEGQSSEPARAVALAAMVDTHDAEGVASSLTTWWQAQRTTESVAVRAGWLTAIATVPLASRTPAMGEEVRADLGASEWMIRELAVTAAATDPALLALVRERLGDEYPRVRVAAIEALRTDTESLRTVAELSRHDEWPIVRAAALLRIIELPDAEPVVRHSMMDSSTRVRIEVLANLVERSDARFVADAIGIVERDRAPVVVELAAMRYLEAMCARGAEAALLTHVERALDEVTERHTTLGVAAAHALERLGSASAIERGRRVAPLRGGAQTGAEGCAP